MSPALTSFLQHTWSHYENIYRSVNLQGYYSDIYIPTQWFVTNILLQVLCMQ